jgi:murein L,D-transpeptidase YcbB/YkuD
MPPGFERALQPFADGVSCRPAAPHPEYRRLVVALAKYRAIAAKGGEASARVEQIAANMERWRWMPRTFERRYVRVNVPEQSLDFVRDGQVVLSSKVIIGRKNSATPILRTMITSVVANPPWNIPGDIAAAQILPQLQKNPNYPLRRITWSGLEGNSAAAPERARQSDARSAKSTSTSIFDTSGKALFGKDNREISNGCVRVQQIFPLASPVLADDKEAGMDRLKKTIAAGRTQHLALDQPMPLYMLYWTAIAGEDGAVEFRPDRYNRDKL